MRWDDDAAVFAAEMNEWRMDWIDTQTDRPNGAVAGDRDLALTFGGEKKPPDGIGDVKDDESF